MCHVSNKNTQSCSLFYLVFYYVLCSLLFVLSFGWQSFFEQNFTTDETSTSYRTNLTKLNQYTQYAYYVKTQVVYKDHENDTLNVVQGQSNIRYFQTEPDIPTAPIVETVSKTNTSIFIQWYPAVTDRELIEYYKVEVFVQPDDHNVLSSRDYCQHPREDRQSSMGVEVTSPAATIEKNCTFKPLPANWESSSDWAIDQRIECYRERDASNERRSELAKLLKAKKPYVCEWNDENCPFEFVENENDFRFTRAIHGLVRNHVDERNKYDVVFDSISSEDELIRQNPNFLFSRRFEETEFNATIDHLKPFTLYTMQFFSCNRIGCSSYYMLNERTEPSMNADDMDFEVSVDSAMSHTVHLDFTEPKLPNGLTVAFTITINDVANMNDTKICITRQKHYENHNRFTLTGLRKGNYSFSVSSISLAMNGSPTPLKWIFVRNTLSIGAIIIIGIGSLAITAATAAVILYFTRRFSERRRVAALAGSRMNILMSEDMQGSRFSVARRDEESLSEMVEDEF